MADPTPAPTVDWNTLAQFLASGNAGSYGDPLAATVLRGLASDPQKLQTYLQANPQLLQKIQADPNFVQYNKGVQQQNFQTQAQQGAADVFAAQQQFAKQLQTPLNPSDPLYQSILGAATAAGGRAAESGGIYGGLAGQDVAHQVAGALANTELQRQQLAANVLAGGGATALGAGNLGLQGNEFQYQKQLNTLAQNQGALGTVGSIAGGALGAAGGFALGGPAGALAGAGVGSKLGGGLGTLGSGSLAGA